MIRKTKMVLGQIRNETMNAIRAALAVPMMLRYIVFMSAWAWALKRSGCARANDQDLSANEIRESIREMYPAATDIHVDFDMHGMEWVVGVEIDGTWHFGFSNESNVDAVVSLVDVVEDWAVSQ